LRLTFGVARVVSLSHVPSLRSVVPLRVLPSAAHGRGVPFLRAVPWQEAAWAISNATSGGRPEQIQFLVQCGAIRPLCDLVTVNDARIVTVALEGLENILKVRCFWTRTTIVQERLATCRSTQVLLLHISLWMVLSHSFGWCRFTACLVLALAAHTVWRASEEDAWVWRG
jgi:hypothetical protein